MKTKYFIAKHLGSLDECIATEKPITEELGNKLIKSGCYKFYAYDKRIHARRYIIMDLEHNYNMPTWLNVYYKEKNKI